MKRTANQVSWDSVFGGISILGGIGLLIYGISYFFIPIGACLAGYICIRWGLQLLRVQSPFFLFLNLRKKWHDKYNS